MSQIIKFDMDATPIAEFADLMGEFASTAGSAKYVNATVESMREIGAAAFDFYADTIAKTKAVPLWHVYEWGMVGDPAGRLWRFLVTGSGATRDLAYEFTASRKPVPVGEQYTGISNDTRNMVHIFYWKAAVMEAGMPVHVHVSGDKNVLVFVDTESGSPTFGQLIFRNSDTFPQHANSKTKGAFQGVWESFWSTMITGVINNEIVVPTQQTIGREMPIIFAGMTKSKAKPITFTVNVVPRVRQTGKVRQMFDGIMTGYVRAARAREAIAVGGL